MDVKVRFAPSPTGDLHVGGLRTALYNYLFACRHRGKLVLRIEDTDQKRQIAGAAEKLLDTLQWAGIVFAEGPGIGGKQAPYFQSQRLEIYQKYAAELLEKGHAYYCFCSSETLKKMKEAQMSKRQMPKYDGRCRKLTAAEVARRLAEKQPCVVRMKIKRVHRQFTFEDLIRGQVTINAAQIDDQVLLKSDGFPTYHLANVVDDHLMEITHVIRGEEWLSSVPKHILLYQYLNWQPPKFAHLPLLLNEDRSKLSKRQGDVAVSDYQKKGYLSEGLLNFVTLLGWNSKDEREIYSLAELCQVFDISGINKAGAVFDVKKLNWINQQHIQKLSLEDLDRLASKFYPAAVKKLPLAKRKFILKIIQPGLSSLDQITEKTAPFLASGAPPAHLLPIVKQASAQKVLHAFCRLLLSENDIDHKIFKELVQKIPAATGVKGKELFKPLRIAITNLDQGPELPFLAEYYGVSFLRDKLSSLLTAKENLTDK